jgi:hypothetical protein
MESQVQKERERLLVKFGDEIVLGGIERGGFISAAQSLEPQASSNIDDSM